MTTITEWFWDFDVEVQLVAFVGTGEGPDDVITLQVPSPPNRTHLILFGCIQSREARHEVMTTTDKAPYPEVVIVPSMDVNITHLLGMVATEDGNQLRFSIDREDKDTHTPRSHLSDC